MEFSKHNWATISETDGKTVIYFQLWGQHNQFWNANFLPYRKPLRIEAPPKINSSKRAFEKYKPRGLFWEFYGTSLLIGLVSKLIDDR